MPRPGAPVSVEVDALDPERDPLRLVYQWRLDGERYADGLSTIELPEYSKGAIVEVQVRASDGQDWSDLATTSARVANRPPTMVDIVLEPTGEPTTESEISSRPRAHDPDGDPIEFRYRWKVNDRPVRKAGSLLEARHFRRGDHIELEVVAYDGEDTSEPLRIPPLRIANSVPRITSQPTGLDREGGIRYRVGVEDPDGDRRFRYRLLAAPEGMVVDEIDGEVLWRPTERQAGVHLVELEVADSLGGKTTQAFEIKVGFEGSPLPAAPAP